MNRIASKVVQQIRGARWIRLLGQWSGPCGSFVPVIAVSIVFFDQDAFAQTDQLNSLIDEYSRAAGSITSHRMDLTRNFYNGISRVQIDELFRYLDTVPSERDGDALPGDKSFESEKDTLRLILGEPRSEQRIRHAGQNGSFIVRYYFEDGEGRNVRFDGETYFTWRVVSPQEKMVQIDIDTDSTRPPFALYDPFDLGLRHEWALSVGNANARIEIPENQDRATDGFRFSVLPQDTQDPEAPQYDVELNGPIGGPLSVRRLVRQIAGEFKEERYNLLREKHGDDTSARFIVRIFPSEEGTFSVLAHWVSEFELNPELSESDWNPPTLPGQRTTFVDNRVNPPKVLSTNIEDMGLSNVLPESQSGSKVETAAENELQRDAETTPNEESTPEETTLRGHDDTGSLNTIVIASLVGIAFCAAAILVWRRMR